MVAILRYRVKCKIEIRKKAVGMRHRDLANLWFLLFSSLIEPRMRETHRQEVKHCCRAPLTDIIT